MRRRIGAVLVCVCVLLPAALAAQPTISLEWTSTTGSGTPGGSVMDADVGDTVVLHAYLDAGVEVGFTGFSLAFDPAVLQGTASAACPDAGSDPPGSNNIIPGLCLDAFFQGLTPWSETEIDNGLGEVRGFNVAKLPRPGAMGPIDLLAVEFVVGASPGAGTDVEVFYEPGVGSVNDENGIVHFPTASATLLPEPGVGVGLAAGALMLLALRRRRASTLAAFVVGGLVLALGSGVARAQDADGDGVPDASDNCLLVPNAPPLDCDVDQDGYGNACDADYDQDLIQGAAVDCVIFVDEFLATGSNVADHDCDEIVGGPDHAVIFRNRGDPPGPSGLACAGTVPCP